MNTGGMKQLGIQAPVFFKAPLLSVTLKEFWGKRWNIPFTQMVAPLVYRPVKQYFGRGPGLFASFLFSGLMHEVAISLAAQSGYGKPTLYFLISALCLMIQ